MALVQPCGRGITQTKLPQALATYNAGQILTFGLLTISKQGIGNTYGYLLPWQEVKDVSIKHGNIIISKIGRLYQWYFQPVFRTPNALIFIYLARRMLKQNASPAARQR